ncbi:hypothetical protein HK100_002362 [Physocladia obscura]|uniref:Alpha-1,3-mannosyltransferase n=1 Tax=Physocladia obscura TaxID=109957 RepID=A0AAD5T9X6_9FUNG|nr:hypothetical protein HK100_002362 [Physocladia obscura]
MAGRWRLQTAVLLALCVLCVALVRLQASNDAYAAPPAVNNNVKPNKEAQDLLQAKIKQAHDSQAQAQSHAQAHPDTKNKDINKPPVRFHDNDDSAVVPNKQQQQQQQQQPTSNNSNSNSSNNSSSNGYKLPKKNIPLADLESNIDLMHARFLDFLNDEEGATVDNSPFGVFGGSLLSLDAPLNVRSTWNRIHQYALKVHSLEYDRADIHQLARRVRANLIAYSLLYEKPSLIPLLALSASDHKTSAADATDALTRDLHAVVNGITNLVFSWIKPKFSSIRSLHDSFSAKKVASASSKSDDLETQVNKIYQPGIVITTGKWHFELAVHAIITLRRVLNCTLPIEIQYMGENDLTKDMRKAFNSMPNVKTVDVLETFNTPNIGGWAIKPFSILASSFRHVIFMDADALFFQDPEFMLRESVIYKQFGQIFYHDRSLFKNDPATWFHGINPVMSKYAKSLRYLNGLTHHEMESGVVVMDKGRTGILHALLMVCQMNLKPEQEENYKNMHGDKETFWMSFDMARVPYKFTPTFGGTVGYKNEKGNVCGGLFHTDEFQRPLWWNGGVLANKHHHKDSGFMRFEYAAFDTDADKIEWEWETETTPFCLGPRYPDREIVLLTQKEKDSGAAFVQLYKDLKENGWPAYFEKNYGVKF